MTVPETSDRNFTPTSTDESVKKAVGAVFPKIVTVVGGAAAVFVRLNVAVVANPETEAVTL